MDNLHSNTKIKTKGLFLNDFRYKNKTKRHKTRQKMNFLKNIIGSSDERQQHLGIKWNALTNVNQLDVIVDESTEKPVVIFKHSTRCSVSRMALRQFEKEFDMQDKITPYYLDLLENRHISNEIATRFGVMHQSPQFLLINNREVVHHASHSAIDAGDLKQFL